MSQEANILVTSAGGWERLNNDTSFRSSIEQQVKNGKHLVMLDIGPRFLGVEYPDGTNSNLSQNVLQQPKRTSGEWNERPFLFGKSIKFVQTADAQSCAFPTGAGSPLYNGLDHDQTSLWNGLRGGLIVPAVKMDFEGGINSKILIGRGADPAILEKNTPYYSYELAGFYAFSEKINDPMVESELREFVKELAEDAPAISFQLNSVKGKIHIEDIRKQISDNEDNAIPTIPLMVSGMGLVDTPVLLLKTNGGNIILSQLIMNGRLNYNNLDPKPYQNSYDPAAEQLFVNMLDFVLFTEP
jgi:hypothetical protein